MTKKVTGFRELAVFSQEEARKSGISIPSDELPATIELDSMTKGTDN